jgi:hypothetical protein
MWKPITGYEGLYEVSDAGEVKSLRSGKLMRPGTAGAGYSHVSLAKNGSKKGFYVHTLVATTFIGPRPERHEVNHKNGSKTDNRAENLEYVTHQANSRHMMDVLLRKPGNFNRGEDSPVSKLTEAQVREIRRRFSQGERIIDLAKQFSGTHSGISAIVHRKCWRHID